MGKIAGLDVRIPSSVMAHPLQAMASLRSEQEVHTQDTCGTRSKKSRVVISIIFF